MLCVWLTEKKNLCKVKHWFLITRRYFPACIFFLSIIKTDEKSNEKKKYLTRNNFNYSNFILCSLVEKVKFRRFFRKLWLCNNSNSNGSIANRLLLYFASAFDFYVHIVQFKCIFLIHVTWFNGFQYNHFLVALFSFFVVDRESTFWIDWMKN